MSLTPQPSFRRPAGLVLLSTTFLALSGLLLACGGPTGAAETAAAKDSVSPPPSATAPAAKSAGPLTTARFETQLPEGWEVMADDLDRMGLMTLSQKGTGGAQAVYVKFEGGGGWHGDPMAAIETFATRYDGTPASQKTRNGIDWAHTRYTYNGIAQSLNITAHQGYKVTFTVMGDDYDDNAAVRLIFDQLQLR